ncbi:MAG: hypothetical protein SFX73_30165 [Kofleriaceae bacterium]|nr:hypothetical protein [Kofleriaceae bacterium]
MNLSLEQVRGNIGGDCGTPDMIASDRVEAIGAAAVPYLVRAIGDRDEPVATFACRHAVRYGITDALRSACQSSRATKCCGGLDAEAAKQAMLPKILVGGWQDGCKPGTPRLEIDDVASGVARWCQGANDGAVDECTPVDALVVEGSILAVTVRDETRRFDAYEVVFADGKTPPQWVLWAVASSGCNWLRAANHGGRP